MGLERDNLEENGINPKSLRLMKAKKWSTLVPTALFMRSGFDDLSMVIAAVFLLALAVLAGAILIVKRRERKEDVLHGGFVEKDNGDW
jgi:hypothetical protein